MNSSSPQPSDIVPFGKYRGQPVESLLADQNYIEWVQGQPGLVKMLQERYPAMFNIITVGAPTLDDSPEHNKMQALFLKEDFQDAFLEAVLGKSVYQLAEELANEVLREAQEFLKEALAHSKKQGVEALQQYQEAEKEDENYRHGDAQAHYHEERIKHEKQQREEEKWASNAYNPPPDTTPFPDYAAWLKLDQWHDQWKYWPAKAKVHRERLEKLKTHLIATSQSFENLCAVTLSAPAVQRPKITLDFECGYDISLEAYWSAILKDVWRMSSRRSSYPDELQLVQDSVHKENFEAFKIELKPQMGDDFPAVLRQMKRNGATYLVIGQFDSSSCSLEEVRSIFGDLKILTTDEILARVPPAPRIPSLRRPPPTPTITLDLEELPFRGDAGKAP